MHATPIASAHRSWGHNVRAWGVFAGLFDFCETILQLSATADVDRGRVRYDALYKPRQDFTRTDFYEFSNPRGRHRAHDFRPANRTQAGG